MKAFGPIPSRRLGRSLGINLGKEIEWLKPLGIKIAVITNSSLLWRQDVRDELMYADWVSVKVDAVDKTAWKHVDRPHKNLELDTILNGIEKLRTLQNNI